MLAILASIFNFYPLHQKSFAQNNQEIKVQIPVSSHIFLSSSTQNGNRRMLFVGTYTDITICGYEGCPPVYSDSISLLNFDWDLLPQNAIVMDAKLNLYHYGSSDYSANYTKTKVLRLLIQAYFYLNGTTKREAGLRRN
jgi:hypothetical protein